MAATPAAPISPLAGAPPRALGSGDPQTPAGLAAAPLRGRPDPARLQAPISSLPGAGPKLTEAAARLGIESIGDMLWHLPADYRDHGQIVEVASLRTGEEAAIAVSVRDAKVRPTRRRGLRITEVSAVDRSGPVKAVWFNQPWIAERLRPGTNVILSGRLERGAFKVSAHELVETGAGIHTLGLVPVHGATEGLAPERLREWAWRLRERARDAPEPLPAELRARLRLPGIADALVACHFPDDPEQARRARRRLALEELICHQLALVARRRHGSAERASLPLERGAQDGLAARWRAALPFALTAGQLQACEEIDADLDRRTPMRRLLMGEVGSGKTVVALHAMLRAVEAGHQAALMAPTETLAEQHAQTLAKLLAAETTTPFALLTGSTTATARRQTLDRLASGELPLIVGTHALVEPDVAFRSLAVCVIDEQHRFGVRQRAALDAKGPQLADGSHAAPHVLHMSATPIPRSLSLTAYGDLDATILRELPAGRQPVKTWAVGEDRRAGAYEFVRERLREGRQAFFVCPLVIDSEKLEARAATAEAERLAAGEFKDFTVELLHGQMRPRQKAEAMERFASGKADVLVATSVIEVGIDVANASVMVIEGADRYGLSQLHQLRGRVGRGAHESYCILFADTRSATAKRRLDAIATESDGFRLAEIDLRLRGEGEILGTRQSGLPRFRAAVLPDDTDLLVEARSEVGRLVAGHERLDDEDDPDLLILLAAARERFGDERQEVIAA